MATYTELLVKYHQRDTNGRTSKALERITELTWTHKDRISLIKHTFNLKASRDPVKTREFRISLHELHINNGFEKHHKRLLESNNFLIISNQ